MEKSLVCGKTVYPCLTKQGEMTLQVINNGNRPCHLLLSICSNNLVPCSKNTTC